MHFLLQFDNRLCELQTWLAVERLPDVTVRTSYEKELSNGVRTPTNSTTDEQLGKTEQAVHFTAGFV